MRHTCAALVVLSVASACEGTGPAGVRADVESPTAGGEIEGLATVVDGDGVEIDGRRIRLFGIDAPETGQYCRREGVVRWRCGQYATVELDRIAGGRRLRCSVQAVDPYDRPVAICRAGDTDVAAEQVRAGWAVAYRRYSSRYVDLEDRARRAGRGIWQGEFEKPWDWRRRTRER